MEQTAFLRMNDSKKKTHRPLVLTSVILAMFMSAIEATIVSTAIPSIVADLGGFSLFSWVFSIYLLMQAVTVPIYGKLADLYGRKPVFAIGVSIFLAGSLLCGLSQNMPMLIVSRLIQGMGAGAVQPIATTIIGDIYTIEERARIQGYLGSVWGISSIVGPTVGGLIVTYTHWAWIFWLNLPLGVIAILGIILYLHEDVEKKEHAIDYLGSSLLLIAISTLMVALIQGGNAWPWFSLPSSALFFTFIFCFALFIWQETRAKEPVMPLHIWKNRVIGVANIASFITGAIMMGVSSFLPTFVQGVMERPPMIAGFTLAVMSIGWPIASTLAGRLMIRIGFFRTAFMGGVALLIGSILFVTLKPEYGPVWAGLGSFFIGVGMGFSTTTFVVSIQSSVDWNIRGVATAANMFMRILGSTVGVALMGGILNTQLKRYLLKEGEGMELPLDLDVANLLLDPKERNLLAEPVINLLKEGLTISLNSVYWAVFMLACLALLVILCMPGQKPRSG